MRMTIAQGRVLFFGFLGLAATFWGYRLAYLITPWPFDPAETSTAQTLHWLFVMGGAIMPYLGVGLAGLALLCLLIRAWRWAGLILTLLALEFGITFARTANVQSNASEPADLSVATFNMQANSKALSRFATLAQQADLIHLSEVPQAYDGLDFDALFPDHKLYRAFYYPGYRGSMIMLVRNNATVQIHRGLNQNQRPIFDVSLTRHGETLRVLATHPLAPIYPRAMAERNTTLARIHTLMHEGPSMPTVIMGDMNTTPFETDGWRLPGRFVGNPLRTSWSGPIRLRSLFPGTLTVRLRIDHIRVHGALRPIAHQIGPDLGSDHLPLFASFDLL